MYRTLEFKIFGNMVTGFKDCEVLFSQTLS